VAWLEAHLSVAKEQAKSFIHGALASASARERLQLLETFAHYAELQAEDEAFLLVFLQDRSKEPRQLAVRLLSARTSSELAQRYTQLLVACLTGSGTSTVFSPPEHFDDTWKKEGIEEKKPQHEALGLRAWWAFQYARLIPLSSWCALTRLTPAQLLAWATHSDWSECLLRAWLQALIWQKNSDWAEAYLDLFFTKREPIAGMTEPNTLIMMLPSNRQDSYWLKWLHCYKKEHLSVFLISLLNALPVGRLISLELATALLNFLTQETMQRDYALVSILPTLACVLPESMLEALQEPSWYELFARIASHDSATRFGEAIKQRLLFHSALRDIL
jgi:hypothetical protein